jgi:hypothetical protein
MDLSTGSQRLMREIIMLIHEHEDAAAFRAKTDAIKQKVNETVEPGNPSVAAFCLQLDQELKRIEYRRQNNLKRLREDLGKLAVRTKARLDNFEGRQD